MPAQENTRPEEIVDRSQEGKLRGAGLRGSDQKDAVDHASSDPDTSLHLDGEEDTLYSDGLEIDDDSETLLGTDGNPLP
jgi:hypothetical protein